MKLVTYQTTKHSKIGLMLADQIVDLQATYSAMPDTDASMPDSMIDLLAEGDAGLAKVRAVLDHVQADGAGRYDSIENVTLLPPVLNPGKVLALGRNYAAHAAEGGSAPPDFPMLFHKTAGSLLGAGGTIIIPPVTSKVDYEAELVVIIGRECKEVSEADALDYVAGYTVGNDVSARDLQRRTTQFTAGKMLDTFGPIGPALVTSDELSDPSNLQIQARLNGEVMQDSNTKMMIFNVPFTVSYISQIVALQPGDVIFTGTPEGVGFARNPPVWLKEGDEITIEVERVGVLTNTVANASGKINA